MNPLDVFIVFGCCGKNIMIEKTFKTSATEVGYVYKRLISIPGSTP